MKKIYTQVIKQSNTFSWSMNIYNGCQHGCLYCYGMPTCHVESYEQWLNARPRVDLIPKLKKDIAKIKREGIEIKDIFVCSVTDAYQPLEAELGLTRQAIELLIENDLPFTVLTKSQLVLRDIDLFKNYDKCRVGLTIITLNDEFRKIVEPYASPVEERVKSIEKLKSEGISTYCSVEPIMTSRDCKPFPILERLRDCVDLFEFGKLSPYGLSIPVRYYPHLYPDMFKRLFKYCEDEDIKYCVANHSEAFLKKHGIKYMPPLLVSDRPYPSPRSIYQD